MIYICLLLIVILAWREWENMRERRGLMDRIVGYKVVLPPKLKSGEVKNQPKSDGAVAI